ncbi:MAG: drug/metabolite transporter (DMT)-like permease [Planctomycetota bacterium]|jgi:drug/metabolite transporter (DMT)-like permease
MSVPSPLQPPSRGRIATVLMLGVVGVSTGAILVRLADCGPLAKAAWRCGLATCILAFSGGLRAPAGYPSDRRAIGLAMLAGTFLAFHFATWIASLDMTSVAASSVLVSTAPVWVAIAAPFVTSDRPSMRSIIGVGVSMLGSTWIAFDAGGETGDLLGPALAIAGAIGGAGYVLLGRRVGTRLPMQRYLIVCYGTAAVLLVIAALINGDKLTGFDQQTWLALIGLALFPQLLGHSSCNWALRWLPALFVSVTFLSEPILSSVFAWIFLHEPPGMAVLQAAPLVLIGIVLAADPSSGAHASAE